MMVGFRGRPNVGLLLSDDKRRYLERQVRRHRAPRSLSDRCRIILRCADGFPASRSVRSLGFMNIPWASGGGGFRLIVLRALWMTPVLAVHARFPMQRWRG